MVIKGGIQWYYNRCLEFSGHCHRYCLMTQVLWLCWVNSSFGSYIEVFRGQGFQSNSITHLQTVRFPWTLAVVILRLSARRLTPLPESWFIHKPADFKHGLQATVPPAELLKVSFWLRLQAHVLKAGIKWMLPNRIMKFSSPFQNEGNWILLPYL